MQGKIHFIKKYIKANEQDNLYLSEIQEFNNGGSLISNEVFSEDGTLFRKFYAEYNEFQKVVLERNEDIEDEFEETKTYHYDEKARLKTEIIESNSGWLTKKVYEYDDEAKTIKIISYDEDDTIEESTFIQYSDINKILCKKDFDEREKLVFKVENEYDEKGNLLICSEFDNKDRLEKEYDYTYNSQNQISELRVYNHKGKIIDWTKYEYNENAQLITQYFMSGEYKKFEYGNLNTVEKLFFSNDVETQNTETLFDKNGNILEEHSQINQISSFLNQTTKFEYIYY